MRITGRQLRQIIREELSRVDEKNEKPKPGVSEAMDKYEKELKKLQGGETTPAKEQKLKEIKMTCAADLKKAGVTGEDQIGYQLQLYYESKGEGVDDGTHSFAIELARLQGRLQEAARRLLRRL
jgi:hypothetical protein